MSQAPLHLPGIFGQSAGHGPVYTDENHAVIISHANTVGHNMNSLLALAGIEWIRRKRFSDIQKKGFEDS